MSTGSSIFDHHVRPAPTSSTEAAPDLMRGEQAFAKPDTTLADDSSGTTSDDTVAAAPERLDFAAPAEHVDDAVPDEHEIAASSPLEEPEATTDPEWTESAGSELTGEEGTLLALDHDASVEEEDSDATMFAPPEEEEVSAEQAGEFEGADSGEGWSREPAIETAAEATPASEIHHGAHTTSADDDQDALAGLGALAGGAATGAALAEESPWATTTASGTSSDYRPPAPPAPPKRDFVKLLLISYAVLVTVAAGLLWKRLNDRSVNEQRLESLPDVRPPKTVGQVSTFDANIALPPGHLLKLGEKRRFGNIEVEATKITRGMVTYEHPAGDRWTLLPEGPVVKLWLRFRNVSEDQAIPPLDKYLVFSKAKMQGSTDFRTNNVVTTAADRKPVGYVLTHDHADKNFLKGQQLDTDIPPGGTLETFIPSTPELDLPAGDLLWRVHLRKGFGKSGAGVTTLIEVAFSAKDIVEDGQG